MALFNEQNEQDLLNIIQGGQNQTVANQPSPFQQIAFSSGFQQEAEPSQQYMFDALRNQGISNENLLYSLQQQFGPESASYWQNLLTPQKKAPAQNVAAPTQNVVAPVQNFAEPQIDVLQSLRDAGLKYQPISVAQDSQFQLPVDQPSFETTQPVTQQAVTQQPVTQQAAEKPTTNPNWFRDYIYQGGADDATATQRGIDYVMSEGMSPSEAVKLWNQSLGTNFAVNDFFRVAGETPPSTTTVFGDSISSVVGYNRDGSADISQGRSLEDILSNYTGGVVNNVATGGQTSQDALSGNTGYGSFEQYIKNNKPSQVILRYGAADAIKMGDANASLNNIEQMINIARQNGSTPVLVGVSPFFGGADSIGGNIAGYLTRESATVADQINAGIQQLAQKYGLQFVNVRDVEIPSGSLLDGVHQDVRLGKAMADKIGKSLTYQEPKRTTGKPPEDRKVALNESTPPTRMAYGGGIGSLAYKPNR